MSEKLNFMTRPLYLQVRDRLVRNISSGIWAQGALIPNEITLAEQFGVSLGTMRKALAHLESEKLIVRKQGRGTYVVDPESDDTIVRFSNLRNRAGERVFGEIAKARLVDDEPTGHELQVLLLRKSERVARIHRVRKWEGRPIAVDNVVMPHRHFPNLTEEEVSTARTSILAKRRSILLHRCTEAVMPITADAETAETLEIPQGTSLLHIRRVMYDMNRTPVEILNAKCHLEKLTYQAEID